MKKCIFYLNGSCYEVSIKTNPADKYFFKLSNKDIRATSIYIVLVLSLTLTLHASHNQEVILKLKINSYFSHFFVVTQKVL